jgi:hypothetical protein
MPETILSLARSNKMYIPFVQGQFNQGGTGALRFCGYHCWRRPKIDPLTAIVPIQI